MRKFAIFTVILTVLVLAVASEILITEYLPKLKKENFTSDQATTLPEGADISNVMKASVLGYSGNGPENVTPPAFSPSLVKRAAETPSTVEFDDTVIFNKATEADVPIDIEAPFIIEEPNLPLPSSEPSDFEDLNFNLKRNSVYLRDEMVQSAGFLTSTATKEDSNGFLFKTVYVDDLYDVTTVKYQVNSDLQVLAKVQVFDVGPLSSLYDVYEVLKARVADSANASINETNNYGTASFYMNDTTRPGVAFLIVKFDSLIYAFSYPKEYHPQISNLVKLIDMEF